MTLSTTTIFVLIANGVTSVVATMLLMLVLSQAPRRRSNQLFALTMFLMAAYSASNGFARFIDDLNLHPAHMTYLAIMLDAWFVVSFFWFASEFTETHTLTTRIMRLGGIVLLVAMSYFLWHGDMMTNIRPAPGGKGSYTADWTPLGLTGTALVITYLGVTALVLADMDDPRGRALWPAPTLVIGHAFISSVVWPLVQIPLPAVFLALAALAMGLPVLRFQLFNPLAALHEELERKHADLDEASRLKSQFLANMSHELRTPLNSIIGYTELIANGTYGPLNDKQRDRLEKVVRNGYHLVGLINDVLDLNRIESGRVTLDYCRLPTPELLDSVLTTIEPMAVRKGLSITRDYEGAPPLYADETRARQIITNILSNAVKFTHEGGVTVRARRQDGMVQFEIVDTGIGIEDSQREAVFAEFRQVDNSTTREYEGTGLGLAITKRLVAMHGGRIWLQSAVGAGSTFYVVLPAADAVTGPSAGEPLQARTVLIIDDDDHARSLLTDTLQAAGYCTLTAANGQSGLTRAREMNPDLIALDVMMPGMDGWQVLRGLKDDDATRAIPVVIVSILDDRPLAISLGACDALTRPLDPAHLLARLSALTGEDPTGRPILVVCGDAADSAPIAGALRDAGRAVETVTTAADALAWLDAHLPGAIVLDLTLPAASGFDVLAAARTRDRLRPVPLVLITARLLTASEQRFLEERCAALAAQGEGGPQKLLGVFQTALEEARVPMT